MKLIVTLLAFSCFALAQPSVGVCPIFPNTNIWNVPVDTLPLHPNSANIVNSIGSASPLRIDDTMPINLAPAGTAKVPVYTTSAESDLGPWPIPATAITEGPNDNHLLIVDQGTCILYESWLAVKAADGSWTAGSTAKWDLRSNALRTNGWTSGDAAGLSITAGVLRYDEVAAGEVKHALRVTAPVTYGYTYTWPARHYASHSTDANVPKMGQRLRLKASFDTSAYSGRLLTILRGLKKYGVMVADNGMSWGMQHDQNANWNSAELLTLHNILGAQMEVVDTGALMTDIDSGVAVVPPPQGLFITDQLGRKNSVPLGSGLSVDYVTGTIVASGGGTSAVTSVAGKTGAVTLGTADIGGLDTTLNSLNGGLATVNTGLNNVNTALAGKEQILTFSAPLSRSGNTISCPTCASPSSASGAATYLSKDVATLGNWKGVYGAAGYQIVGDATKLPIYGTLTALGNQTLTWANSTNDTRALQKAGNGRVAAAWYTTNGMTIEVNIADGQSHKVSLYLVDWDNLGRSEKVEITDLQGNILDTQTVSSFGNGQYLSWNLKGHVVIRLTKTAGTNTVVSGIFFE